MLRCHSVLGVLYSAELGVRYPQVRNQQTRYYDAMWARCKVVEPSAWALWDTIKTYAANGSHLLEIGAGTRPRIPIAGSYFLDLSCSALAALTERNAHCAAASAEALPFPNDCFDLICAFEIVEHVPDDRSLFSEVRRVLKVGERFVFSVPLHMEYWSRFDELAGHARRCNPAELESLLADHGLPIEKYHVTFSPRNTWYRNAAAIVAGKFWRLGLAVEDSVAVPLYSWVDRRRGMKWNKGLFAEHTRRANNAIIVCRKERG
jgi:SAM-dependent methyltransferase